MKLRTLTEHRFFKPAFGAVLAIVVALALRGMELGAAWVNASYDYLFQFGHRRVTNSLVLISLDTEAYRHLSLSRSNAWDRRATADLLNHLADAEPRLVVLDLFFREPGDAGTNKALAEAMRRLTNRLVLGAERDQSREAHASVVQMPGPIDPFLSACGSNYGIAVLEPDRDSIVRRHWPFPAPQPPDSHMSLPWTAAKLYGADLVDAGPERWLRYYGPHGPWQSLSCLQALTNSTEVFSNKIVFVGNQPDSTTPGDGERDKFSTPYTRIESGEAVGGVEILATAFLNLINGDWLRRPAAWVEWAVLGAAGFLLGIGLCYLPPWLAIALAGAVALGVMLGAASQSYYTNYWFPWLIIAGGQVPCALAWALASPKLGVGPKPVASTIVINPSAQELLDIPDYELFRPPFGEGAFGEVFVARNAVGQWQALKIMYLAKFGPDSHNYDCEFNGIERYKPISNQHPGLLKVDFVSRKRPQGFFYYVMELGDALTPGWEKNPASYRPLDLATARAGAPGHRLPVTECVRIGIALAEALDFLHRQGLTHRDVKPQNIIFVNHQPKLADVGLVAEILQTGEERTWRGTLGYMPPQPEPPGTPRADIYGLGMVLYVISTGRGPDRYPELSTTLVSAQGHSEFMALNPVILKACEPDRALRYASAAELREALLKVQRRCQERVSPAPAPAQPSA